MIEDCNSHEDTAKLLKFCCWENPHFSSNVLSELLWHVAYSYTYELRPHLDLLLQMLLLEDSWQTHRILNALKGTQNLLLHPWIRLKSIYRKIPNRIAPKMKHEIVSNQTAPDHQNLLN